MIAGWYLICSSQKSNSGNFFEEAVKVCQEATVEWVSVLPCFPLSALGHSAYLFLTIPPFHLPQAFTSSVIETDRAKSWIESKNPVSFQTLGSQGNMEVECVEAVTLPGNRAAVTGDLR